MEKKVITQTTEEYSISPNSGRLRKRVRLKKKKSFFSKGRVKRLMEYVLWVLILAAFLYSLIVVIPELGIVSDKKMKQEKSK